MAQVTVFRIERSANNIWRAIQFRMGDGVTSIAGVYIGAAKTDIVELIKREMQYDPVLLYDWNWLTVSIDDSKDLEEFIEHHHTYVGRG